MQVIKYSLRKEGSPFSTGTTDLKLSHGSLIDTNGCVALLVTSGYAIATINFKKRALRRGDFILSFYDGTLSIERASSLFSVRYASFAYDLIEEAIYKPLSDQFWNILYENPVFHTAIEQKKIVRHMVAATGLDRKHGRKKRTKRDTEKQHSQLADSHRYGNGTLPTGQNA